MTTYGSLSNAQFVTLLYANVLGRAPDQGGLDFWVSSLQGGALRERVVLSFSESAEFIQKTAQMLVGFMQMSVPTFADILDGGAGDNALIGGFGADRFEFTQNAGGSDVISGWDAFDAVRFVNFGYASAASALAHFVQNGADVVFSLQGQTITFADTKLAEISAGQILLA